MRPISNLESTRAPERVRDWSFSQTPSGRRRASAAWLARLALPCLIQLIGCTDGLQPGLEIHEVRIEGVPASPMVPGEIASLRALAIDPSGAVIPDLEATWSSSDSDVVTIDGAGRAAAVRPGTATVTAEVTNQRASKEIRIDPSPLIAVSRSEISFSAAMGDASPASGVLEISNAGGGSLTGITAEVIFPIGGPGSWLSATFDAQTSPARLTLRPQIGTLPPNYYTARVRLTSDAPGVAPTDVSVTLQIMPAWSGPLRFEQVDGPLSPALLRGVWREDSTIVAVGDKGAILRSANLGASWTSVQTPVTQELWDVWGSGKTMIAVGTDGAMVRSTNGGMSWIKINQGFGPHFHAVAGTTSLLVAVGNDGVVARSTDLGNTWDWPSISTGEYLLDVWGDGQVFVAIGHRGTIFRSTNAGLTWSKTPSGTTNPLGGVWGEGNTIFVVGKAMILRSTDRGATWTETWTPPSPEFDDSFHAIRGSGSLVMAVGGGGTIVRSLDRGLTWSIVPVQNPQSMIDLTIPLAGAVTSVGPVGAIMRSTDGGVSWQTPWATSDYEGIARSGSILIAAGARNTIRRSTDEGRSWSSVNFSTRIDFRGVAGVGQVFVAGGTGGYPGVLSQLARSTDGGLTWVPVADTEVNVLAVWAEGSTFLASGINGMMYRSTDSGATWTRQPNATEKWLVGLAGTGPVVIGVGGREGPGNSRIVRSTDGGKTWTVVHSGGNALNGVWGDGSRFIAVGEGGTILRSENAGLTWTPVASGTTAWLVNATGRGATIFASGGDGTSITGTSGVLLRSTDGGLTWRRLTLPATSYLNAPMMIDERKVIVAGLNGAILRGTE